MDSLVKMLILDIINSHIFFTSASLELLNNLNSIINTLNLIKVPEYDIDEILIKLNIFCEKIVNKNKIHFDRIKNFIELLNNIH